MASNVVPIRDKEPLLQEEAVIAARIANGIRAGDAGAETELVERYSRGVRYLLMRRVHDEERARDLLQETLCIAIEKLRATDLENPERLAGYLRGIAVRVTFNANRRRNREPYPLDIEAVAAIPDAERRQFQQVSEEQTSAAVRKLLNTMPVERDRELLIRLYVYDQDRQEICRALGLDSLHFNRVLYRAKGRFRKLLEQSGNESDYYPSNRD